MINDIPTTSDFQASQRLRRNLMIGLVIAAVSLIVGTMTALAMLLPQLDPVKLLIGSLSIMGCLTLPVLICYNPRVGLYILFVGALLFPGTGSEAINTMPGSYVPFWLNLSTIASTYFGTYALAGFAISPAEIIAILTLTLWFVRAVALRQLQVQAGAFMWPISAYMMMVAVGFVNGLTHGANMTMALYEIRGQAYFFMMYVMAVNLITDRRQLMTMLWIIVVCNGLQGFFGTITYFVMRESISEDGFMGHDESLILNLIFFVAILAGTLGTNKKLMWAAIWLSPLALIAVLGNQRRASIAAFMIAFLPLMPILWTILKERREQIGKATVIFAFAAAIYLPLAWNATGPIGLPARAIRSQTEPSARDQASNDYRYSEAYDLLVTRDASPIIGYGYGKPFLQPNPLPQVTTDFVYYMPHNSILWVWMRVGHIGFFLFWLMFAAFWIKGLQLIKAVRGADTRAYGLLAILMTLMILTFGKFDLALTNLRALTITAVLLGPLSILPKYEKRSDDSTGEEGSAGSDGVDGDSNQAYSQLAPLRQGGPLSY